MPKSLRTVVVSIAKQAPKSLRDDRVLTSHKHGKWTMVIAQIILRGKTIPQEQAHWKNSNVRLSHIG